MRSNHWPSGILVLWVLLAGGAGARAEPVQLRWKFRPGETLRYTLVQKVSQKQRIMDQDVDVSTEQTLDIAWKVEEVAADGTARMEQSFTRIRLSMKSPFFATEYDSENKEAAGGPIMASIQPIMDGLARAKFAMRMGPDGAIRDVELDKDLVELLRKNPVMAQMGGMFSAEGMKQLVAQGTLPLPEGPIEPGKTWDKKVEMKMPFGKMVTLATYTYQGARANNVARIDLATQLSIEGAAGPIATELTGQESKGWIDFDIAAGRLRQSQLEQTLALKITIAGRSIDQQTTTITTFQLAPASR